MEIRRKKVIRIKTINAKGISKLVSDHVIYNTKHGYVNANGNEVGFIRTKHKRYIEDRYSDMSSKY